MSLALAIPEEQETLPSEDELTASVCRSSFAEFVKEFWSEVPAAGNLIWNWHMDVLCTEMQRLAQRVFDNLPKEHDAVFNVPFGTSKSTICSILFHPWTWTRMPTARHMTATHTQDLALDLSSKSREVIRSERYQQLFPEIEIVDNQDAKGYYRNTWGGVRQAFTVGGKNPMGFHFHFLGVDDPLDPQKSVSQAEVKNARDFMNGTIPSRKVDKEVSVTFLIMQRLDRCLLPGTLVRTKGGERPVELLNVGNFVLGSAGWQKIERLKTSYHDGLVYGFRLSWHPATTWLTGDHEICTEKGWVEARDVCVGDWIRFPLPSSEERYIPWEEPRRAEPPRAPAGSFTGERRLSIKRNELSVLLERGLSNIEIARVLGVHRNTIQCYLWHYKLHRIVDRNPLFGRQHLSDPLFWRAVGYWLAEGSFSKGRNGQLCGAHYTFGGDERHLVAELVSTFGKYDVTILNPQFVANRSSCTVFCSQFARWLRKYFGKGAHHKRLPEFVFGLPEKSRRALLSGWTIGDGHRVKDNSEYRVVSVSMGLLHGFQRLALGLGLNSGITGPEKAVPVPGVIDGYNMVSSGKGRELRYGRKLIIPSRAKCKIEGGFAWYKVRKISNKRYDGPVYDLTTPSHDFVCGNMTVHNCDPTQVMLERAKLEDAAKVRHICLPGEITEDVHPPELKEKYIEGLLDPRRLSRRVLKEYRATLGTYSYAGQVLQNPKAIEGGMFEERYFNNRIKAAPYHAKQRIRYWDRAASVDSGASCTAGTLMCIDFEGFLYVEHCVHGQWEPKERNDIMRATALRDRARYGPKEEPVIWVEREGGSSGRDAWLGVVKALAGFYVKEDTVTGDKDKRAEPWSSQCASGLVRIVDDGTWDVQGYVDEHTAFKPDPSTIKKRGRLKDRVDSSSGACNLMVGAAKMGTLRTLTLGGKKKGMLRIIVCASAELATLAIESQHKCLLISLLDPPHDGHEVSAPEVSAGFQMLDYLQLVFADLQPKDFQERWNDAIMPYNKPPEQLVMSQEHGKKLWGFLRRKRPAEPEIYIVADNGDNRALSVAYGVCAMMGLDKDATIYRLPECDNKLEDEPKNGHIFEMIKSTRGLVV